LIHHGAVGVKVGRARCLQRREGRWTRAAAAHGRLR
jgi:hypothetical protein